MQNFLKGIVVGLGAIAPGLSGSVLLVIFGLYQKTVTAISTIFKNFKKNLQYLLPLVAGIGIGILLFSRLVDWLLTAFQMQTRFAFLGLIIGAIPLFYQEVRKQGFEKKHYLLIVAAFACGMALFNVNRDMFPEVTAPNVLQSMLLGVAVAASYIVPGLDSAAILSALGLYNLWVHALATLDFSILLPALAGAAVGVLVVSFVMDKLIARWYTPTFSVIFGLFLAIVPAVMNESCVLGWNGKTVVSMICLILGFTFSLLFSNWEKLVAWKNQKRVSK